MPDISTKIPFYIRASLILVGICALGFLMVIGRSIILPLCYATLFAILLDPVVGLLQRVKIPRIVAIAIVVLTAFLLVVGLMYFLLQQAALLTDALPTLKQKGASMLNQAETWAAAQLQTNVGTVKQQVQKYAASSEKGLASLMGTTLTSIKGLLIAVFLLPVYIFMILHYKPLLLGFIMRLFRKENHETVGEVLMKSRAMMQQYLAGLLAEASIVATLNTVGLLALGVPYALVLGVVGAMLNIIPYIGGIVAVALPMLMAILAKDSFGMALGVAGLYAVIQFVDNNFLIPKIVASRVKVNALMSIIVVLIGGALWGVAGMFLAIPFTAVLKIIFDRVPLLEPWGYLLGDDMGGNERGLKNLFRKAPKVTAHRRAPAGKK